MLRRLLLLLIVFSVGNAEVDTVDKCPYGWRNFGVQCYKYFPQTVNWITAERNCQSLDANLASVHSNLENDFLLNLIPASSHSWIGVHDAVQEGQWLWGDGSEFGYSNWCSGEPNNAGGNENCVHFNAATSTRCWNDLICTYQIGYTCAKNI